MKNQLQITLLSEMEMGRIIGKGSWIVFWTETCYSDTLGDHMLSFSSAQEASEFMMDKGSFSCVSSMSCSYACDTIYVYP